MIHPLYCIILRSQIKPVFSNSQCSWLLTISFSVTDSSTYWRDEEIALSEFSVFLWKGLEFFRFHPEENGWLRGQNMKYRMHKIQIVCHSVIFLTDMPCRAPGQMTPTLQVLAHGMYCWCISCFDSYIWASFYILKRLNSDKGDILLSAYRLQSRIINTKNIIPPKESDW